MTGRVLTFVGDDGTETEEVDGGHDVIGAEVLGPDGFVIPTPQERLSRALLTAQADVNRLKAELRNSDGSRQLPLPMLLEPGIDAPEIPEVDVGPLGARLLDPETGLPRFDVDGNPVGGHDVDGRPIGDEAYRPADMPTPSNGISLSDRGRVRCDAVKADMRRCKAWSMTGATKCGLHGGSTRHAHYVVAEAYKRMLGSDETLLRRFESFFADPDIHDIRAELAMQRTLLGDLIARWPRWQAQGIPIPPDVIVGMTQLNMAIARLAKQVEEGAGKRAACVSTHQVSWLLEQIVDVVHDVLTEEFGHGADDDLVAAGDSVGRVARVEYRLASALERIASLGDGRGIPESRALARARA